jgi:hypothetical protein
VVRRRDNCETGGRRPVQYHDTCMSKWKDSEKEGRMWSWCASWEAIDCNVLRLTSRSINVSGTTEDSEILTLHLKWSQLSEMGLQEWLNAQPKTLFLISMKPGHRRKTCPSTTLSTTNPTWIDPGANPGSRGKRPATNRLSHGTAQVVLLISNTYLLSLVYTLRKLVFSSHYIILQRYWGLRSARFQYPTRRHTIVCTGWYINVFTVEYWMHPSRIPGTCYLTESL